MTRKKKSPPSDDDLLEDRELRESTNRSSPQRTDDPSIDVDVSDDRPLPLIVITQSGDPRKLLDYFLTADIPDEGYNKTKIAEESGVTTNGIRRHIDTFLEFGIVERTTSEDAHIKRYTTNKDSDVHRKLRTANNVLAQNFTER